MICFVSRTAPKELSVRYRQYAFVRTTTAATDSEYRQTARRDSPAKQPVQVTTEKLAAGMTTIHAQRAVANMQLLALALDFDKRTQRRHANAFDRLAKGKLGTGVTQPSAPVSGAN